MGRGGCCIPQARPIARSGACPATRSAALDPQMSARSRAPASAHGTRLGHGAHVTTDEEACRRATAPKGEPNRGPATGVDGSAGGERMKDRLGGCDSL
jgi:hypothetical protein